MFKITEMKEDDAEGYVKLKDSVDIYITGEKENVAGKEKYVLKNISFINGNNNNVNQTVTENPQSPRIMEVTREAELENGKKVTITAYIREGKEYARVILKNDEIEGEYSLKLAKTSSNNNLSLDGAKFKVVKNKGETNEENFGTEQGEELTTVNGSVNVGSTHKITSKEQIDTYEITEIESAFGYYNLKASNNTIGINVKTVENSSEYKYEISELEFTDSANSGKQNDGTIYKDINLEDGKTVRIKAWINKGDSQVIVNFENAPTEWNYKMQIKKIDSANNKELSGAKFEISKVVNGKEEKIDGDGNGKFRYETQANGLTEQMTLNTFTIENIDNVNQNNNIDTYKIKETKAPTWYLKLAEEITIKVKKGLISENEYGAIQVAFEDGNFTSIEEIYKDVRLTNGNEVKVGLKLENGVILVTVKNDSIEGNYSLKVVKRSNTTKELLEGVKFKINKNNSLLGENGIFTTNNEGNILVENQKIDLNNFVTGTDGISKQEDIFEIQELIAKDYMVLESPVRIKVTATKNDDNKTFSTTSEFVDENGNTNPNQTINENRTDVEEHDLVVKVKDSDKTVTIFTYSYDNTVILSIKDEPEDDSYYMQIEKIDNSNNTKKLSGAKFDVKTVDEKGKEESLNVNGYTTAAQNGRTEKIYMNFSKEEYEKIDKINIYEDLFPSGYIGLKSGKPITLYLKKGVISETEETRTYGVTGISFEDSEERTYTYTLPSIATWEMGKTYTYALTLGNGSLTISSVSVVDWQAVIPITGSFSVNNWTAQ